MSQATPAEILIVGAGIFGVTAALELRRRGHDVLVIDPGPIPHPLAASTDISKVVRMEYGTDEQYMAMVEQSLPGWHKWNEELGETLYHETGVTMFAREPMAPGSYEHDSYQTLLRRGHQPERLNADEIARRFPAWKPGTYVDGFYHAQGGFVESGRLVAALVRAGEQEGVRYAPGQTAQSLISMGDAVSGVSTREGATFNADHVLIAAGAWTHILLPELAPFIRPTGHPVFHLKPSNPLRFMPPHFATFTADVARTGWYGFPFHPREQVIKIANHGVGQQLHPENDARVLTEQDEQHLRAMLVDTFPDLVDAPIVYTRRCLYCDTLDEHLWIDQHPQRSGLSVASGGSGHAMKFGPVLGPLVADAIENQENPWLARFRWRHLDDDTQGVEAARYHG